MKAIKEGNDVRNFFQRRNNEKRCLVRIVLKHCQVTLLPQKLMLVSFVERINNFLKLSLEEGRLKKAEELLIGAYWKLSKHNPNEKQANNMTHKGEVLDER